MPSTDSLAPGSADGARLLKIGVLAVLVLGCAIPLAINIVDPDLWGHVRYGQEWIADGKLPRTTTHSFTAEGYPWINHENLAELAFAWGFDRLGVYPMLVVKCLWGLAILASMAWVATKRGVHPVVAWLLLLLVAQALQAFFPMRPQLLSFAWFAAVMVCCDRAFCRMHDQRDGAPSGEVRLGWLVPLPALVIGWVNSHGGFALGVGVAGVLLIGRMIELLTIRGRASWPTQAGIALTGLSCLAALLVNPYGAGLLTWLYYDMSLPRPEISEWAAPVPGNPVFTPFVTLQLVALVSLVGTRRRRDWTHVVILALTCWQSWLHLRHVAFFALMCGFWLPEHVQSTLARLRGEPKPDGRPERAKAAPVWLRGALGAAVLVAITAESWALANRLSDFPVYRSRYPVDVMQFMVDRRMKGNLVVNFNWAQYALAALAPDVKVSFDGRCRTCYPQELHDMTFDFLVGDQMGHRYRDPSSGPIDVRRALDHMNPDMVLVDRTYRPCTPLMEELSSGDDPPWTLLYSNQRAALYGRTSKYGDPASPDYMPPELRRPDERLLQARFQWPALPDRSLAEELDAAEEAVVRQPASFSPPLGATN
ncbi:MAG: hypothetical protein KF847_01460 [Pirellulales bacterium]|nr:hypothetical protein [Pirellulales bacterium]